MSARFIALGAALLLIGACREVDVVTDDGDGTTVASTSVASTSAASSTAASSTAASSGAGGGWSCGDVDCTYAAENLFTNAGRIALLKTDLTHDLCFQLVLTQVAGETVTFDGGPGELARVTNHASDCTPGGVGMPPEPVGEFFDATGLVGTVTIAGPPCVVTADLKMLFDGAPPWAPAAEALVASDVPIIGNCP